MRKDFLAVAAILFTVIAAGCTTPADSTQEGPEENISDSPETQAEVDREITVEGGSFYFEPDTINVSVNETIRFVFENEGGTHDMRIPELGAGTEIISGGENQSFTVTFDEEGSIEFICSVGNHAEQGMTGTIQVS